MKSGTIRQEREGATAVLAFSNAPDGLMDDGTEAALEQGLAQERTLFRDLMVRADAIGLMAEMTAGRRDIRTC